MMGGWRAARSGAAWRALLLACLAVLVLAAMAPRVTADSLDDEVRQIAKQLRCPICESVSVADSPAELAGQMRAVIRKKLEAGETEQQILDYFVAAYGDSVLLEPPRRGLGWFVWLVPSLVLLAGAVILWLLLRIWVRSPTAQPTDRQARSDRRPSGLPSVRQRALPTEDPFVAQADQELDAVRRGQSR